MEGVYCFLDLLLLYCLNAKRWSVSLTNIVILNTQSPNLLPKMRVLVGFPPPQLHLSVIFGAHCGVEEIQECELSYF